MISARPERTDTRESRDKILRKLKNKSMTANEVIDSLFRNDVKSGRIEKRSWKYYVHLNKLFSPMEKSGEIEEVGIKLGPTNRSEKIWSKK